MLKMLIMSYNKFKFFLVKDKIIKRLFYEVMFYYFFNIQH